MSLEYFSEKAIAHDGKNLPDWASSKNKSLAAYQAVECLYEEKLKFIRENSRKSDFRRKSDWQINGAELARAVDAKLPTIMHNKVYSHHLKTHLISKNEALEKQMVAKIKSARERRSRGPVMRNKDELVDEIQALKSRVKELEALNAEAQVSTVVSKLTLPILKKLGWT